MPSYIITCKKDADDSQVESVKQHAKDQGGSIIHEYSLIKGFAVTFPENTVHSLDTHPHVENVEADSEMRTQ
ncbi:Proteinase inhibitor, propeptide [Penicillium griseofulvum]|uniref:Proteinase inhibitor, propeptide n=1 Tax=Penicillium patulum TaxID=5078 RepID=A0A135LLY4_PENPA|nr:Proteinase inhibitor, propeptide [Penicillium griseofulvum]KXG49965.1 Proteinase inhibitor, propeptide [Penicillium griseofulvum]